jgi:hypothetical protein
VIAGDSGLDGNLPDRAVKPNITCNIYLIKDPSRGFNMNTRLFRFPNMHIIITLMMVMTLASLTSWSQDDQTAAGSAGEKQDGENRYVAHVSTDKPIYRTGETVYIRTVLVHAHSREPMADQVQGQMEIISPRGDTVSRGFSSLGNGALGFFWLIDESAAGGDYHVKVSFPHHGYPPAEREFNIRAYQPPRLRSQIEFARKGYGPGDEVTAILEVTRSEGGIPNGAKVTAIARVDQQEAWRGMTEIDESGMATVRFPLPEVIESGEGTLSLTIEDGGIVETAAKTIPILVSIVDLQVYPEGGELVSGVENRVYFEAIAPNGRPADVIVELVDSTGSHVVTAASEHEGRGQFLFTPVETESYSLKVVDPWTVKTEIKMPPVQGRIGLHTVKDLYSKGEPLEVEVALAEYQSSVRVVVNQRDLTVADRTLPLPDESYVGEWLPVTLSLPESANGVLRVTVFDHAGVPRAERLVFREVSEQLKIELELDRERYTPGGTVSLKVRTTDSNGNPVAGTVGLTVSDDATLELIERREQAPRLPVQVYLEPEVRELADAHVYLSDDGDAPRYLDLLLGTQGWRRFAFIRDDDFIKKYGDAGKRVLAHRDEVAHMRYRLARGGVVDDGMLGIGRNGEVDMFFAQVANPQQAEAPEDQKLGALDNVDAAAGPEVLRRKAAQLKAEPERRAGEDPAGQAGDRPVMVNGKIRELRDAVADNGRLVPRLKMAAEEEAINGFIAADEMMEMPMGMRMPMTVVRIYAHVVRPDRQPGDRVDFTETLYWNAGVTTDDKGEASVDFDLSDSVTQFRAMADGYTTQGVFGSSDVMVESRRPFYVEVKAPIESTFGDRLRLPVVLVNETDESMETLLSVSTGQAGAEVGDYPDSVRLEPGSRKRVIVPVHITHHAEDIEYIVSAQSGVYSDHVTRTLPVQPSGFPVAEHFGGLLKNEASHALTIPADVSTAGLTTQVLVYPSPLANLTQALEAMIRDPHGCFEQTSSTNYPLVMAMQYFQTHTGVDPELIARSQEKLEKGYKRLVGYECKEEGFEWFGGDPGHEALSAYGLLEFTDMAAILPVDPKMLERTRSWLLNRRDGKGGFKRNERALDSFGGAPEDITNGYITWALACAGQDRIQAELDALQESASKSDDPYLVALAAGALMHSGRTDDAAPLLGKLVTSQDQDGPVTGAKTSITRSGGQSLLVETTALAILAWLPDPEYAGNVEQAMKWLLATCEGGRFGATQSTVLALKAIIEYDKARAHPKAPGRIILNVDGHEIESIDFTEKTEGAITFAEFYDLLSPGEHTISLGMVDGSEMPYSIAVEYHALKPVDSAGCPLNLDVVVSEAEVVEGEPVEVIAQIRNTSDEGLPMTMCVVGLPGGLEPRHEQLKESVEAGHFSFYEIRGRDVALYFRDFAPLTERKIVISTIAALPGTYQGQASRAYLYYTPESRKWVKGVVMDIQPK